MRSSLRRLSKYLCATLVVVIIALGVSAGLVRALLPLLGDYREQIQSRASELLGQPVTIRTLSAGWEDSWLPSIKLSDIKIHHPTSHKTVIGIKNAEIGIYLWRSLKKRGIRLERLTLDGVQLGLVRRKDGHIGVVGINGTKNRFLRWALKQPEFSVDNAQIIWYDLARNQAPIRFSNAGVTVVRQDQDYEIKGHLLRAGAASERIHFSLHAKGDLLSGKWSGTLNATGQNLQAATLLAYQSVLKPEHQHGRLDVRLTSHWHNATPRRIVAKFRGLDLSLNGNGNQLAIDETEGTAQIRQTKDDAWRVDLDQLQIRTPRGSWPRSEAALYFEPCSGRYGVNASFLRIQDVLPLVSIHPSSSEKLRKALAQYPVSGDLRDIKLRYSPENPQGKRLRFSTQLADISIVPRSKAPGLIGLNGTLRGSVSGGELVLATANAGLVFPRDPKPVLLRQLAGRLRWQLDRRNNWGLSIARLSMVNQALDLDVSGTLSGSEGQPARADLAAHVKRGNLERLAALLPKNTLKERTYNWLTRAFSGGIITNGEALLQGKLGDFPFDTKDTPGRFQVAAQVTDAALDYHPKWPPIEDIEAEVRIVGRGLSVHGVTGSIYGMALQEVRVDIPQMGSKRPFLELHGQATGSGANARRFVFGSPLRSSVGVHIEPMTLYGDLGLDLKLHLPLSKQDQAADMAQVDGKLEFYDNRLLAEAYDLDLTQLSGTLRFDRQQQTGTAFDAHYFGFPVHIDLGLHKANEKPSWVKLYGQAHREFIDKRLRAIAPEFGAFFDRYHPLAYVNGQTPFEAVVTFPKNRTKESKSVDAISDLIIRSQLKGLAIQLPAPLEKQTDETRPIEIITTLSQRPDREVSIRYGDDIKGYLKFATRPGAAERQLENAVVQLGNQPIRVPASPPLLWFGGALREFDPEPWLTYINSQSRTTASTWKRQLTTGFDINVQRFPMIGQTFKDLRLSGNNRLGRWRIKAIGDEIGGTMTVPEDTAAQHIEGIKAHLDILKLESPTATARSEPSTTDPRRIPPLSIRCDNVEFDGVQLGKMTLLTQARPQGLWLEQLDLTSKASRFKITGDWTQQANQHRTRVNLDLHSADLGQLLTQFGYSHAQLEAGPTQLTLDATWDDSPGAFSLNVARGEMDLNIESGRMLDIDHNVGKIFGLLSFQNLQRRLSLDFDDLFQSGFPFDQVQGHFTIEGGNAHTQDLTVTGPSARILLSGRIGLTTKDYEQLVTVTPHLAESLPVASAIFGPVGVGVGAAIFLAEQMFESLPGQIDSVLSRQYKLQGSWDKPTINPVTVQDELTQPIQESSTATASKN